MSMQSQSLLVHGQPCLRLQREGASAIVALHGAQVLSWTPADGRERLFLSERARFGAGQAIRGGIPVIFPQFGARGPLPRHGFARSLEWETAGIDDDGARFALRDDARTAVWPHRFLAQVRIGLDATSLQVGLDVLNTGAESFEFSAALHTYLRVEDLDATALHGLQDRAYEDSAAGGTLCRHDHSALRFVGEIDRIHAGPAMTLTLEDGGQRLAIAQGGFTDTVVWNPGAELAARLDDLAPGDHRHFVCVEAGQILAPVALNPGQRWSGTQTLG